MSGWDFSPRNIAKFLLTVAIIIPTTYFLNVEKYAAPRENAVAVIRSGPGAKYDEIRRLRAEERAKVIVTKNSWHKVVFDNGITGWIDSSKCKLIEERSVPWFGAGGPLTDDDGFTSVSYQLMGPQAHGLPIYRRPDIKSKIVRRTRQFETYRVSNREHNGFTHVKMDKDSAIGWVLVNKSVPSGVFSRAASSFFMMLVSKEMASAVLLGLCVSFLLHSVLHLDDHMAEAIHTSVDVVKAVFAGLGAFGATVVIGEVIPHDVAVAVARQKLAAGATYWFNIAPIGIAASLSTLIGARPYQMPGRICGAIGVLLVCYMFYFAWGYAAGWWQ